MCNEVSGERETKVSVQYACAHCSVAHLEHFEFGRDGELGLRLLEGLERAAHRLNVLNPASHEHELEYKT